MRFIQYEYVHSMKKVWYRCAASSPVEVAHGGGLDHDGWPVVTDSGWNKELGRCTRYMKMIISS